MANQARLWYTTGNMAKQRRTTRFHLLVYERMWQLWALPSLLTVPASLALWWYAPRIPVLRSPLRHLALVPALASAIIFVYAYLARRMAWVQCRPKHLRIQTPIYALAISYGRIKGTRPEGLAAALGAGRRKGAARGWLRPYLGKTALFLDLSRYPLPKLWLRLLLPAFLLQPDRPGLVLLVEDWMALSNQIDSHVTEWRGQVAKKRQAEMAERMYQENVQ